MGRILFLIALSVLISRIASGKKKKNSAAGRTPAAPSKDPTPAEGESVYQDLFSQAEAKETVPAARPRRVAKETVRSSLKQIDSSVGHHNVEASSISGHSHQETSLTGIEETCQPEPRRPAAKPAAASAAPGKTGLSSLNSVTTGISNRSASCLQARRFLIRERCIEQVGW